MGSLVCVHVAAAAILEPQWDICTGRHCTAKKHRYWRTASVTSALVDVLQPKRVCLAVHPILLAIKERSGLNRISHPDWVKLSVELNCAPNQNTNFPFHYTMTRKSSEHLCMTYGNTGQLFRLYKVSSAVYTIISTTGDQIARFSGHGNSIRYIIPLLKKETVDM